VPTERPKLLGLYDKYSISSGLHRLVMKHQQYKKKDIN
jgi:hypothetical protein